MGHRSRWKGRREPQLADSTPRSPRHPRVGSQDLGEGTGRCPRAVRPRCPSRASSRLHRLLRATRGLRGELEIPVGDSGTIALGVRDGTALAPAAAGERATRDLAMEAKIRPAERGPAVILLQSGGSQRDESRRGHCRRPRLWTHVALRRGASTDRTRTHSGTVALAAVRGLSRPSDSPGFIRWGIASRERSCRTTQAAATRPSSTSPPSATKGSTCRRLRRKPRLVHRTGSPTGIVHRGIKPDNPSTRRTEPRLANTICSKAPLAPNRSGPPVLQCRGKVRSPKCRRLS